MDEAKTRGWRVEKAGSIEKVSKQQCEANLRVSSKAKQPKKADQESDRVICRYDDKSRQASVQWRAVSSFRSPEGERAVLALYDAWLARWPVPHATSTVRTRHGDTFVIESGAASAPALVLLHGAGTNSTLWAGDVLDYACHYRVLAADLPGEPGRSAPNRPSWQGSAYAEWLEDVLDAHELAAATIVGLSQGGFTALKLAVTRPERVAALVLASPGGIVPDKLSFVVRALPWLLLGQWGIRRVHRLVLAGQAVPAEVEEAMTLLATHARPRVGALPLFTDDELRRLTMPVQLLMGARDALRDAERITARMKRLVPHVAATVVPDAGHALVGARAYVLPFLARSLTSQQQPGPSPSPLGS
jgi:pimeloyl-ACP methyl ester carboxylesterase